MLEPRPPIEDTRPGRFRPTHCPRRHCPAHRLSRGFRWRRRGSYRRACQPNRRVPRIQCLHCGATFSRQSFSCTYYLKRPELLRPVAQGLVAGSAHRRIAHSLGCAPSTVTRQAARIGRHCLLFQAEVLESIGPPSEPIVWDHFVTFVFSQLDRLGIGTPIGRDSWFDYGPECASWKGSSRRAARKKPVQGPLPSTRPGSAGRSLQAALDRLVSPDSTLELITDDHPAYPPAIAGHPLGSRVRHVRYANPLRTAGGNPAAAAARDRAMFPVDMVHLLSRHVQAHHRRETVAFSRRSNASMERAMIFAVWRNFIKPCSERRPDPRSPAMRLGIARRRFGWRDVLARRKFPDRTKLSKSWTAIYRRELITPAVGRNLRHRLIHAY